MLRMLSWLVKPLLFVIVAGISFFLLKRSFNFSADQDIDLFIGIQAIGLIFSMVSMNQSIKVISLYGLMFVGMWLLFYYFYVLLQTNHQNNHLCDGMCLGYQFENNPIYFWLLITGLGFVLIGILFKIIINKYIIKAI
ncbi:hypothetical protein [Herpetosiphon llansteffanensis]|uniref:hypothetical protein n=1 Tax=Herpetosiphon llansteffanensis TaxID=2094568 RepID=UPI000D7C843A|nr:hypothetical protein [Herpetosiphon llansteffanensis]